MIEQAEKRDKLNSQATGALLDCLLAAGSMKNLPRTGWRLAGIKECESVADHSFRVVLIALMFADRGQDLDRFKLLKMAVLHELPESMVTDLPLRTVEVLGREAKYEAERQAWGRLLPAGPLLDDWQALWEEFEAGKTKEAKLVRAADKFEMLLQAYEYERTGYRDLQSFWGEENFRNFDLELLGTLLEELELRRAELGNR